VGPITNNCDLCHTGNGRGNPFTLWSIYDAGNGRGCAGCHGREYGETIGSDYDNGVALFPIAGLAKSSAWGLRRHHNSAGITECIGCHGDMEPFGEDVSPIYYSDPVSGPLVTDPCADNLDNDGDDLYDAADPDCAPATTTTTTSLPGTTTTTTSTTLPDTGCVPSIRKIRRPRTVRLRNTSPNGFQTRGSVTTKKVRVLLELVDAPGGSCVKGTTQTANVSLDVSTPGAGIDAGTQAVGLTAGKKTRVRFEVEFAPANCEGGTGPPTKEEGGELQQNDLGLLYQVAADASMGDISGNLNCKPSKWMAR
jgi:hypothetical protein